MLPVSLEGGRYRKRPWRAPGGRPIPLTNLWEVGLFMKTSNNPCPCWPANNLFRPTAPKQVANALPPVMLSPTPRRAPEDRRWGWTPARPIPQKPTDELECPRTSCPSARPRSWAPWLGHQVAREQQRGEARDPKSSHLWEDPQAVLGCKTPPSCPSLGSGVTAPSLSQLSPGDLSYWEPCLLPAGP